ncbi:spermatogenesis-associated serine-rich protein 2-like isoform X2 [Mytilus californianus]|uniref:spermatogenesis-associated serine-rich protein 2-like isoform X2 n=1 Tax=Mytilus californianus TaxID=6549 RepID=UPI002247375D|nr:spermatogenesis-associated serine-rich protein 2-like isoform X2 [Mytilus californianus]
MMARKNTLKTDNPGSIHFDPRTKSVMAETSHLQDNIKEKVNAVREVVPGKSNNEIILVLQFYDYNVEKAIQGYVEDGAKQALQEWHYPGNKAPKKKRNKKKKPANDNSSHVNGDVSSAETVPNGIVANGSIESDTEPVKTNSISDISSSVSSLSLSPTTCTVPSITECDKVNHVTPTDTSQNSVSSQKHANVNHVWPTDTSQNSVSTQKHAKVNHVSPGKTPQNSITTSRHADNSVSSSRTADKPVAVSIRSDPHPSSSGPNRKKSQSPIATGSSTQRNKSQSPQTGGKPGQPSNAKLTQSSTTKSQPLVSTLPENISSQPPAPQRQTHPHSRPHHSASHSHRQRTASERISDGHSLPKQIHKTLEKSVKDLHRQTVSLERLRLILDEEMDKNYKRIKSVFDEMRTCLNDREVELIQQMDQVKVVASDTFHMRQNSAVDLKKNIDRADRMDDKQIAQLRADVKHFVSERKMDEDLSRTTRFLYDSDYLKKEISQFGEVVPVKCTYSIRRPSVSSVASTEEPVNMETSETTPVSHSESEDAHPHGLDRKATEEVAELQQRLKNSLHVQGYDKSSPRPSSSQDSRENPQNQRRQDQRQYGGPRPQSGQRGRGYGYRGRGRGEGYRGRGRPRSPRKDYPQEGRGTNSNVNSSL